MWFPSLFMDLMGSLCQILVFFFLFSPRENYPYIGVDFVCPWEELNEDLCTLPPGTGTKIFLSNICMQILYLSFIIIFIHGLTFHSLNSVLNAEVFSQDFQF